jgi:enamine deaminase RidA (YjgF/YER057c/UK114 family)
VVDRAIVNPWTWQDQFGFVQANKVSAADSVLYCAGQTSVDGEGRPLHAGDMGAQLTTALDNLEAVLGGGGMALSNVVRLNYYTTDLEAFFGAAEQLGQRLAASGCRPASTLLNVVRLAFPELMIEIEATAVS